MSKTCRFIALVAAFFSIASIAAASAAEQPSLEAPFTSITLTLSQELNNIHVSDPSVVDIIPKTSVSFILLPASRGSSSVAIYDEQKELLLSFMVNNSVGHVKLFNYVIRPGVTLSLLLGYDLRGR
jgi:Flp pilus assembly secretin CpaC